MKHLIPSLAILAVIGATPAFAADFTDSLTLKPDAVIQARAQLGASGTNSAGQDYNIYNGAVADTETARFSIRRARFGVKGSNADGWFGQLQFRAAERADAGTGAGTRTAELYYANLGKTWKSENYEQTLIGGLYKPFNGESSISSSTYMFPSDRVIAHWIEQRNVGMGYQGLALGMIRFGADVQNGSSVGTSDSTGANTEKNGLYTSGRIEIAPGKEFMPSKKQESFAGAEGTHVVLGFDYQNSDKQITNVTTDIQTSITTFGPDLMVHINGLSFLAEYRTRTTKQDAYGATAAAPDVKGSSFDVVAGYAFLLDNGMAVEPALRYAKLDLDKDNDGSATDGTSPYSNGEWTANRSGDEFGIGLNLYWTGHKNKTQLAYTSWKGETPATGDEPKAHIFTIQHQVTF